ncbi:hypothetical protein AAL_00812 [Moelleriella libera RCEF 2490]|uniref:Uncharacterized protein n=1 Tax=Moelleriella libera RCEF 2490 TaxID=1081109 RepID=A0A166V785_9HYPO|nr:hypothetical protein AAL_00812 [Moelleriella libera RCEF 2490]
MHSALTTLALAIAAVPVTFAADLRKAPKAEPRSCGTEASKFSFTFDSKVKNTIVRRQQPDDNGHIIVDTYIHVLGRPKDVMGSNKTGFLMTVSQSRHDEKHESEEENSDMIEQEFNVTEQMKVLNDQFDWSSRFSLPNGDDVLIGAHLNADIAKLYQGNASTLNLYFLTPSPRLSGFVLAVGKGTHGFKEVEDPIAKEASKKCWNDAFEYHKSSRLPIMPLPRDLIAMATVAGYKQGAHKVRDSQASLEKYVPDTLAMHASILNRFTTWNRHNATENTPLESYI